MYCVHSSKETWYMYRHFVTKYLSRSLCHLIFAHVFIQIKKASIITCWSKHICSCILPCFIILAKIIVIKSLGSKPLLFVGSNASYRGHLDKFCLHKSNRKEMNRNWCNKKANPALKKGGVITLARFFPQQVDLKYTFCRFLTKVSFP